MRSRVDVRLLDGAGALLAWAPVEVEAWNRRLMALGQFEGVGERDGTIAELVICWPELNVQRRSAMSGSIVKGAIMRFGFTGPVLEFGSDEGPLPPVTVRAPVVVGVETGGLGAKGAT